jgi:hypothetical protein
MASERPDKADLYQQAGREMAERHEQERLEEREAIQKEKEETKNTLQFATEEHRARMMRLMEERHDYLIESLEKKQREERTGEREAPEVSRAKDELDRQAKEDREPEKIEEGRAFNADQEYIQDRIDQLIDKGERAKEKMRQYVKKHDIDSPEVTRSVRREYEEKIREWEDHRDQWAEKSVEERNRLLERLDREMERDPLDRHKSFGRDRSR